MALITEYPYNGKTNRICHYSDAKFLIEQNETGRKYEIAVDKYPCKYTYTETNEPIPEPEEE